MSTPYTPSVLKPKLKVGYYHHDHWRDINGSAVPFRENLTIPHVCIYGKDGSGSWSTTDFVYATTCHEVVHVSHWEMIGEGAFAILWLNPKTRIIPESWAVAVEWGLTNLEYKVLGQKYLSPQALSYNFNYGYQSWYLGRNDFYTPLFIDLIDDFNQKTYYNGDNRPDDKVKNYTLSSIESILFGVRDYEVLKAMLKMNKPVGVTDGDIDDLINYYRNI